MCVEFFHKDYGLMTATITNFVECWLFEACDREDNIYIVKKADCSRPLII